MTREDYERIAAALYDRAQADRLTELSPRYQVREAALNEQHRHLCHNVADALAEGNPSFDRGRFLRACGISGEG